MRIRLLLLFLLLSAAACDKPSEADCQKAVDNINKIYGQPADRKETAPAVRRCRSASTNTSVNCVIAATTKEQVEACEAKQK